MREETEAEVLARIEATRTRMGETIDRIGERVNPDRVQAELKARARSQVNEVKANVRNKARNAMRDIEQGVNDAGRGVWDTIRENPIPAGMIGVGLAWLAANGVNGARRERSSSSEREVTGYTGYADDRGLYANGYATAGTDVAAGSGLVATTDTGEERGRIAEAADAVKEKASQAKDRVSETAGRVQEKAGDMMERTRDRASHALDATRDRASDLAHRAGDATRDLGHRARSAEKRVEYAVRENPVAAGAIAAALGLAAGLLIPETEREQELLGPTRDRLMGKAERSVRRVGERAREAVRESASEAARHVVDEVMDATSRSRGDDLSSAVTEPGR